MAGDDKAAIDTAAATLSEASAGLAQKIYAEQARQAEGAAAEEGADSDQGEDVVDAEFEEVDDAESK